jgi:O-antigen/teichoic acid export membrane protein
MYRVLNSLTFLSLGAFGTSLLGFIAQVILARRMSLADYGQLAALLVLTNLLTPLASFGLNWFWLRVFAQEGRWGIRWLRPSVSLLLITHTISLAIVAGYAVSATGHVFEAISIFAFSSFILLGQSSAELGSAYFQLHDKFRQFSVWQGVTQIGRFVVAAATYLTQISSLWFVTGGYAVVGAVTCFAGLSYARRLWGGRFRLTDQRPPGQSLPTRVSLRDIVCAAAPFPLQTILYLLYFQGNVLILERMASPSDAAVYNAAFVLITAIFLIPNIVYMRLFFARICLWSEHNRPMYLAFFHVGTALMLAAGLAIMLFVWWARGYIIDWFFGPRFTAASDLLLIMAVSIPVRFVQSAYAALMVSSDDMWRKNYYSAYAVCALVVADLILIPVFGLRGAAAAFVVAEITALLLFMRGASRWIAGIEVTAALRPATLYAAWKILASAEAKASGPPQLMNMGFRAVSTARSTSNRVSGKGALPRTIRAPVASLPEGR